MIPSSRSRPRSFFIAALWSLSGLGILLPCCPLRGGPFHWPTPGTAASPAAGASPSQPGAASVPGTTGPQIWLQRSAATLQAVQAMQAAARAAAAAAASSIPNGLAGLQVATGSGGTPLLWQGANAPVAASGNANAVTVTQTQQQALLEWQTFNIGKDTSLTFDQSAGGANVGQWIAFNYVRDPSGNPAQILGVLRTTNGQTNAQGQAEAGGQVYVIDANGIIFGGASQVNAGALVASSLPINAGLIQRGLLNNPDDQFLFSALPIAAGSKGPTAAFDPSVAVDGVAPVQTPFDPSGSGATGTQYGYGGVTVQAGASLTAPDSAANVGGKIALIGPDVVNDGTINTPDGQAILAAGLQVGLAAHDANDPHLRGLDVYVGSVTYPSSDEIVDPGVVGTVTNDGDPGAIAGSGTLGNVTQSVLTEGSATIPAGTPIPGVIEAPRADVWMAGANVYQLGVIDSSTSVSYNGRIDLTAQYGAVSTGGNITGAPTPYYWTSTGGVTLGPGSLTQVLPQLSDASTIVGAGFYTLALTSQVNLQGSSLTLDGSDSFSPGAALLSPNGTITAKAGSWQFTNGGLNGTGGLISSSAEQFTFDQGSIDVGAGAVIDAAGSQNVGASVTENIVTEALTSTELADSPVEKNSPLLGQTIQFDATQTGTYAGQPWVGTPLADTSGYLGLIQHTAGELTIDGGSVNLESGGPVSLQSGSDIDVSGGWINYGGAYVQTTKLVNQQGQIIDISQATPNVPYEGIYTGASSTTDSKWGVTQTTANPIPLGQYEPGYTEGGNAGSISIQAPSATLSGTLAGQTNPGSRQVNPAASISPALQTALAAAGIDARVWELDDVPAGGSLALTFEQQYAPAGTSGQYDWYSPTPPDIYLQSSRSPGPGAGRALVVPTDLFDATASDYGGFTALSINDSTDDIQLDSGGNLVSPANAAAPNYGTITIAAAEGGPGTPALTMASGGILSFAAANIDLQGGVVAPGGHLTFTSYDFGENSSYTIAAGTHPIPAYDPTQGNFVLAPGVSLNVAGLVVDNRASSAAAGTVPAATQGGAISIAASNVSLGSGSTLDVSGGAAISSAGKVNYGPGGALSIGAGADPDSNLASILGGTLAFAPGDETNLSTAQIPFQGFSGGTGGSLKLTAPLFQIGTAAGLAPAPGALVLSPGFFSAGGFSSYTIGGLGAEETDSSGNPIADANGNALYYPAVYVVPDTVVYPRVAQMEIVPEATGYSSAILEPFSYETTPVTFELTAKNTADPTATGANTLLSRGDVVVGSGAVIETDPQSSVTLSGATVAVLGSVIAPGGNITIKGDADSTADFAGASGLPTVDLGPQSGLFAGGTTVLGNDPDGAVPGEADYVRTGVVLPGGSIQLAGNIVIESGARLNVDGWSDTSDAGGLLNLSPSLTGVSQSPSATPAALALSPTVVSSNGGTITLAGGQGLWVAPGALLSGAAGGAAAVGGSLSVSSGTPAPQPPQDPTLLVTQTGTALSPAFYPQGETAIGNTVKDINGDPLTSMGYFGADGFNSSGMASLALDGTVSFQGAVTITAPESLTVGTGGVILADGAVDLSAPYVDLGQPYQAPLLPSEQSANPPFLFGVQPIAVAPTAGGGSLSVTAGSASQPGLIDVGNLSLQGIAITNLTSAGDIRGFGYMDVAGSLNLKAAQIYAPTAETFAIAAYDYTAGQATIPGTVNIVGTGGGQPPLSAGSTLDIYASVINQGGTLIAPDGQIDLGWNGSGTGPADPITQASYPATQTLNLETGSVTSVSGAIPDSVAAQSLPIPYGLVVDQTIWSDPLGNDITTGGPPAKSISLSGENVSIASGAAVNTSGGGDLFAYEFVPGTGGTNDILSATSTSFAVIPGYEASYAPYASFNQAPAPNGGTNYAIGDLGYVSATPGGQNQLAVGEQVYLNLQNGSGPQAYTLLPARYALLPGAYLVTPLGTASIAPTQSALQPDGSSVVTGYTFNAFDPSRPGVPSEFDVALGTPADAGTTSSPSSVVRNRALYTDYFANTFFAGNGGSTSSGIVQVPSNGGDLEISATTALTLDGAVTAGAAAGGAGGFVDIASPEDIMINDSGNGGSSPAPDTLYLSSSELSGLDAGSLLIGGTRVNGDGSASVTVTAGNVTLDNPGDPLTGQDIILVANNSLVLDQGSALEAAGTASAPVENLLITGDGVLLRASAGGLASSTRTGVDSSSAPTLQIGAGATVSGAGVTVDSTSQTSIDPTASLNGDVLLGSGQISLVLNGSPAGEAAPGSLVLTGGALSSLEANATALSLVSYSSIDTYGAGQVGTPAFTSLSLQAGEIRGFGLGAGDAVTFAAKTITLDNTPGASDPGSAAGAASVGTLAFDAGTIDLGANTLAIDQFADVNLTAGGGIFAQGAKGPGSGQGALSVGGNLTLTAPVLTAAAGSVYGVTASGVLALAAPSSGTASIAGGLGAQLTLTGSSVAANTDISVPSGQLTLHATGTAATGGNVTVGGRLDASGVAQTFNDAAGYTDGGTIDLVSDNGNVAVSSGGSLSVAAPAGGGDAGTLSVSASAGTFAVTSATLATSGGPAPTLDARNGQGGAFSLDVLNLSDAAGNPTGLLSPIEAALTAGGFSQSQNLRVRNGDVTVDGAVKAATFDLSADTGSIEVTGKIDASGATGGAIELDAGGSVALEGGSLLTVQGQNFNDAGQGGSVTLQAGAYTGTVAATGARQSNGQFGSGLPVVDIEAGSTVNLSVIDDHPLELNPGGTGAKRAAPGSIAVPAQIGVYFPDGTPGSDEIFLSSPGIVTTAGGASASVPAGSVVALAPGSTVTLSAAGNMTFAGGTGGSIPLALPSRMADGTPLAVAATDVTDLTPYDSIGSLRLVAPQVLEGGIPVDVQIDPILGAVDNGPGGLYAGSDALYGEGSVSLVAEGLQVFQPSGGTIDAAAEQEVQNNAAEFAGGLLLGPSGATQPVAGNTSAIQSALAGGSADLGLLLQVRPGAEIVNPTGNLTLNTTWNFAAGAVYAGGDPSLSSDWDLSNMYYRFGPSLNEPGYLTLRAQGNVDFAYNPSAKTFGSLNDGFAYSGTGGTALWQAVLLPAGSQSWSFLLTSGADLSAADPRQVLSAGALAPGDSGSVLIGQNAPALAAHPSNVSTTTLVPNNFETIRTGSGGIGIYSAGNVELMNNLATIYTAGTQTGPLANFELPAADALGYPAQYTTGGGNIAIVAQGTIEHVTAAGAEDSSRELPTNWLDREGWIDPDTGAFGEPNSAKNAEVNSTSWWVDYDNFFEGVGALGGGNLTLIAGGGVSNVDAVIPTNERTTYNVAAQNGVDLDAAPADQATLELGGGDLLVRAGGVAQAGSLSSQGGIDGGVYYVERGQGALAANGSIFSNSTRATIAAQGGSAAVAADPNSWLPTTLFLGQGNFTVEATGNLTLGPVANPFLLPQSSENGVYEKTYFSTYNVNDTVAVGSLAGSVTIKDSADSDANGGNAGGTLADWFNFVFLPTTSGSYAKISEPWLATDETSLSPFEPLSTLAEPSLYATAFNGDIDVIGAFTLSPSPTGELSLLAEGSIQGLQPNLVGNSSLVDEWGSAEINLSDSNPAGVPGVLTPLSFPFSATSSVANGLAWTKTPAIELDDLGTLFQESGSVEGNSASLQTQQALNTPGLLHGSDLQPVELYAETGSISGLTLFSAKKAQVLAGGDITDISLYVQNEAPTDISTVIAGGNIDLYDPDSSLRLEAQTPGNALISTSGASALASGLPTAGDIQISGPGTLEVLAGGSINLGDGPEAADGTSVGITSIGNARNPYLPFAGASIVAAAGISGLGAATGAAPGLVASNAGFSSFIAQYMDPSAAGANAARYLPELATMLGIAEPQGATPQQIWDDVMAPYADLPPAAQTEQEYRLALDVFYLVLRDAGRDHNNASSPGFGSYADGYAAIQTLFPASSASTGSTDNPPAGNVTLATRLIETQSGGDISVLAPTGEVTVGNPTDPQKPDQGILTEHGGNTSIFAENNIGVGTSRIFTLQGGNVIVWSTLGSIAAGSGSRTVFAAPPTRVLIDPQSGDVQNDLAGLATGSGIGVLATLAGVVPGSIDLIAPIGTVDAGEAGIRASGSINIAAARVLNASNIQAGGTTTGVPVVSAPNIGGLTSASSSAAAASSAANQVASQQQNAAQSQEVVVPSIITVEVLGYGGGDDVSDTTAKGEGTSG